MTQAIESLRVDGERLWSRLEAMAKHGATKAGGCNRQALTDEDKAGRDLFVGWCEQAGMTVSVDEIGNVFANRPGTNEQAAPVITGSHLDTQPSGGRFDGILGVLAGLEVVETLNDAGVETVHPIVVIVWTNEEGCRFPTAMMGSAVWSGKMSLDEAYALTDRAGASVKGELVRIGYLGGERSAPFNVHAAFELHIEQGPVLEAEATEIGVVNGVQHMSRHRVVITGQEAHAGPTPMKGRKDPMMALAEFLPRLYAMAEEHAPDARITFGFIEASPGSNNTVPGRLELTVDIRHPDKAAYDAMISGYQIAVNQACDRLALPVSMECFWEAPGVVFDDRCIDAVRRAVDTLGYSQKSMFSGAGHDACNVADVAPTSMVFVPCEGGLSHNEKEAITLRQAEAGTNVLLHAMVARAIES